MILKFLTNKTLIEDAIRAAGFEASTILRPSAFMANWIAPKVAVHYSGLAETGTFNTALRADSVTPWVDEYDVAAFSIAAFKDPARFNGLDIQVASVTHTTEEVVKLLSQAIGLQLKANYLSDEEISARIKNEPLLEGEVLTRSLSKDFDMEDVRKWGIPLHTFQDFLEREKASLQATYGGLA